MIKSGQDLCAGLVFLAIGVFILVMGRDLSAGTAGNMQEGYFPRLVALLLCLVGAIISVRGMMVQGASMPRFAFRSMLPMIAIVAFALLLRPAGLAIAISVLIVVSSFGMRFRLFDVIALSLSMIVFIWLVFIKGLGLPLQLGPSF